MRESQETPVETPADRRVDLDEQPLALAEAESAGTLPDEDRRVYDAEPVVEEADAVEVVEAVVEPPAETLSIPVGEISHIRERPDGTRVDAAGHLLG